MHNLILVDDAPWILKDMEQIIDWSEAGFRILAAVGDVNAAESLLRSHSIDVVISDIRMPGKSGMDLLTFINRASPRTLVVFMSAYGEFAYAKEALEKGCFHYMLKPVNTEELLHTLERCSRRLAEQERDREAREAYGNSMRFLEWIENDVTIRQAVARLAPKGAAFPSAKRYSFATVKGKRPFAEDELRQLDNLLASYRIASCRWQTSAFKWTLLGGWPDFRPAELRKLWRELRSLSADREWDIGISSLAGSEHRIGRLYHQANTMAETSMLYGGGESAIYRYRPEANAAVPALRERIARAARLEHLEAALFEVHKGISSKKIHIGGLVEIYNQFVVSVAGIRSGSEPDGADAITGQDLILHCGNPGDLLEEMRSLVDEQKKKPDEAGSLQVVEDIARDLDRLYAHRISLKDMARKYFLSPNYLSHLFKQEKGQSFINYLIQRRLEAAVSLLEQDISLYEVGRMVGYDDYAHFSKLFKKHVGLSPFEYKQSMKRQPGQASS
ncbi:response regulator transcription factor [Cohnella phaseoli]|uniref:YesN/AraC family two-component response regulator n=1 Tax=Cohnella phaseoli TaxID=456490 RepID=A0A3D9IXE9_9BACL|nr:response regulator [Cohnella phaseoli]RED66422.1 YesN/AraC family two-component response regulator [Cohnella phaseoli]